MKEDLVQKIVLTDGVTAQLEGHTLKVKGPKGEVERSFPHPKIEITLEEGNVVLKSFKATRREKTVMGSYTSHIRNFVRGVVEPFVYKLKICSGHFPMNVTLSGQEIIIKNFLGEAVPRRVTLPQEAKVKITGTEIEITSLNKEVAGQAAAKIESLCRITNRDRRIFQDGCYIILKAK